MNNKFGKYGVIVVVPNYILPYSCGRRKQFKSKLLYLIEKYMEIDVCNMEYHIEQDFNNDTSLVRITSKNPANGLIEHSSFGCFIRKNFPVEEILKDLNEKRGS